MFSPKLQCEGKKEESLIRNMKESGISSIIRPTMFNGFIRKFANPLSYLGGPVLPSRSRTSLDTILSLD